MPGIINELHLAIPLKLFAGCQNLWGSSTEWNMAKLVLDRVLKRKKLSKRKFAKMVRKDYSSVFRYFRKGYDPKLSMLALWAKVLGVKIKSLYRD